MGALREGPIAVRRRNDLFAAGIALDGRSHSFAAGPRVVRCDLE